MNLPVGYKRSEYKFIPRIIMAVESIERKFGKTHFGMTAPGDIAYASFDKASREDVLAKFPDKVVYDKSYCLADAEKEAKTVIEEFSADHAALCKMPNIRTINIDTGSDLYGLLQLALFGKMTSIPPFRYYEINQWFSNKVIAPVVNSNKSLIISYIMAKRYVKLGDKDAWDGTYERKGFRDSDGLSQLNVRLEREMPPNLRFKATIINSSQNAATVGMEFISDPYQPEPGFDCVTDDPETDDMVFCDHRCSFPFVAHAVFPTTKLSDWV